MKTNGKMIPKFDAWVSGRSCIVHQFQIEWGEGKKNSGIAQEVMEYVPTTTYGKQNKINSKRKMQ